MNRIMLKAAAIALPMVLGTAIADDTQRTQDALSGIVPMNSSELAMVTGAGWGGGYFCYYCSNNAAVGQVNTSGLSAFVFQGNSSGVAQSNN